MRTRPLDSRPLPRNWVVAAGVLILFCAARPALAQMARRPFTPSHQQTLPTRRSDSSTSGGLGEGVPASQKSSTIVLAPIRAFCAGEIISAVCGSVPGANLTELRYQSTKLVNEKIHHSSPDSHLQEIARLEESLSGSDSMETHFAAAKNDLNRQFGTSGLDDSLVKSLQKKLASLRLVTAQSLLASAKDSPAASQAETKNSLFQFYKICGLNGQIINVRFQEQNIFVCPGLRAFAQSVARSTQSREVARALIASQLRAALIEALQNEASPRDPYYQTFKDCLAQRNPAWSQKPFAGELIEDLWNARSLSARLSQLPAGSAESWNELVGSTLPYCPASPTANVPAFNKFRLTEMYAHQPAIRKALACPDSLGTQRSALLPGAPTQKPCGL